MADDLIERLRASAKTASWQRRPSRIARTQADADLFAEAAAALERVNRDSARLDFLDRCNARLNAHYGTNYQWELILNHNVNRLMLGHLEVDLNDSAARGLPSCRDAIDGVMDRAAARALAEETK